MTGFMNIAHRGGARHFPENSIPAFEKALGMGATHIEVDIRMTKDDVPVVLHDERVNRMTDGAGYLSGMDLEVLAGLKLKGKGPEGEVLGIPTLEQVLEVMGERCGIILDIKTRSAIVPAYEMVEKAGLLDRVVFTSKDGMGIMRLMEKEGVRIGLSNKDSKILTVGVASKLHADYILPHKKLVNRKLMQYAEVENIKILVWTVDSPRAMRRMIKLGVHGIITNRPDRLADVCSSLG